MKNLFFTIIFIMLTAVALKAANEPHNAGAASAGMGTISPAKPTHWAIYHNQAALSGLTGFSFGVYSEKKFLLADINTGAMAVAAPLNKNSTIAAGVYFSGNEFYRNQRFSFAYAHSFEKVKAGIQFNYFNTSIIEYAAQKNFAGEAGIIFNISNKVNFLSHIFNPAFINLKTENNESLPVIVKSGFHYYFSEKLSAALEIEKELKHVHRFKSGFDYKIADNLNMRAGLMTNPFISTFGFTFYLNSLSIDVAVSMHPSLGATPHLSADYFSKR